MPWSWHGLFHVLFFQFPLKWGIISFGAAFFCFCTGIYKWHGILCSAGDCFQTGERWCIIVSVIYTAKVWISCRSCHVKHFWHTYLRPCKRALIEITAWRSYTGYRSREQIKTRRRKHWSWIRRLRNIGQVWNYPRKNGCAPLMFKRAASSFLVCTPWARSDGCKSCTCVFYFLAW